MCSAQPMRMKVVAMRVPVFMKEIGTAPATYLPGVGGGVGQALLCVTTYNRLRSSCCQEPPGGRSHHAGTLRAPMWVRMSGMRMPAAPSCTGEGGGSRHK